MMSLPPYLLSEQDHAQQIYLHFLEHLHYPVMSPFEPSRRGSEALTYPFLQPAAVVAVGDALVVAREEYEEQLSPADRLPSVGAESLLH
jgi:hypothetical protein